MPLVADDEIRQAYVRALSSGDLSELQGLHATHFAVMTEIARDGLGKLQHDGITILQDVTGKGGEVLGSREVEHPAAERTFDLLEMLGSTAAQQRITPKSAGEGKQADAATTFLERAQALQKQLAGAS